MASQWLTLLAIVSSVQLGTTNPIYSLDKRDVPSMETQNTNGNLYENAFFGLSVEKPEEWYAMTPEQLSSLLHNAAVQTIANSNDLLKEVLNTATSQMTPLFGFMPYPLGTQGKLNPNIIGFVMNIGSEATGGNDCDTLTDSTKIIQSLSMTSDSKNDCRAVDINGKKFAMQESSLNIVTSVDLKQTKYVKSTKDGYLFLLVLTYFDDGGKQQLENIMHSLKLSKE